MTAIISRLCNAAAKRAAYNRTVAEISAMNRHVAMEDLNIYTGDAAAIAYKAVYGR